MKKTIFSLLTLGLVTVIANAGTVHNITLSRIADKQCTIYPLWFSANSTQIVTLQNPEHSLLKVTLRGQDNDFFKGSIHGSCNGEDFDATGYYGCETTGDVTWEASNDNGASGVEEVCVQPTVAN